MTSITNSIPQESTLDFDEWGKLSYECALTIKDILNLKPGEQIKVLSMDRNVWDTALRDDIRGKSCRPQDFFNSNWAIYAHEENLRGKFLLFSFECKNNVSRIDVDKISLDHICQPNFEFDIEYKDHCYYPLSEEYLPASDPQGFSKFPWPNDQKQHWTNFPETTRVGWRGHFVLWSKLETMPNIIWPFPKEAVNAFVNENNITIDRWFKIETDDNLIKSLCETFDFKASKSKSAARSFSSHVTKKFKKNNVKFPISYRIDIIEKTENSKYQTYKYSITCEEDGPVIDGWQKLGRRQILKIK